MGYYSYKNQKQQFVSCDVQDVYSREKEEKFSNSDGYVEEEDTVYELDLECIKKRNKQFC